MMEFSDRPLVFATVTDEDTVNIGGDFFKRERTCHLVEDDEGRPACSKCKASYLCMSSATWCPDCGARVERDA